MARYRVVIPQRVLDNCPGGVNYDHFKDCMCICADCQAVPHFKSLRLSLSGGGSRYGEIAGAAANAMELHKISNISGCSAGSIITILIACGAGVGRPNETLRFAFEEALNVPQSRLPWRRARQIRQHEWLKEWIEQYWDLCAVPWGTKGRIRNLLMHMIRLCAPCNIDVSPFAPSWKDPWKITLILKSIFCGGVNDNQKCFVNTAKLFPKYFYHGSEWITDSISCLMVDAWCNHPRQVVLNGMNPFYDHLGPHVERDLNGIPYRDVDGNDVISRGKNEPLAAITFSGPYIKTIDVCAASCSIPALMKAVLVTVNPANCLIYNDPDAAEKCGYIWPPPPPYEAELYDGGLWQTMPIFQTELNPNIHLPNSANDEIGVLDENGNPWSNVSVYSPYMTDANVYSHAGDETWKQRYNTGPWKQKPGWFGRLIWSRVGTIISTLYSCATWDQTLDLARDQERGAQGTLTCTDYKVAREFLMLPENRYYGSDTYPWGIDHLDLPDMPDSRTMKDGWTDKLMMTDVILGYLSAEKQGLLLD